MKKVKPATVLKALKIKKVAIQSFLNGLLENASYPFEVVDLYKKYPNYNIVKSSINGYNIYDYLTYIIDHYDDLPNIIVFCKGNTFPRHVSEEKFRQLVKLKCFTPIEDWKAHDPNQPSLLSSHTSQQNQ